MKIKATVIDHQQGSEDWLAHRAKSLNASELAAAMGLSKYMTRAQLIAQVRQLAGAELPAVLMSGTLSQDLRQRAQAEACLALSKPVRPMQLRALIDRTRAHGQLSDRPTSTTASKSMPPENWC